MRTATMLHRGQARRRRTVTRTTRSIAAIVIALVLGGWTTSTARAVTPSGPIVGSAAAIVDCDLMHCPAGSSPMSLTLASVEEQTAFSLCDLQHSWCVHGPLWTVVNILPCSAVSGNTWYGGIRLWERWYAFKVVDGGTAVDRVGLQVTSTWGSGPCGAGDVATSPVLAGDFRIVRS